MTALHNHFFRDEPHMQHAADDLLPALLGHGVDGEVLATVFKAALSETAKTKAPATSKQ